MKATFAGEKVRYTNRLEEFEILVRSERYREKSQHPWLRKLMGLIILSSTKKERRMWSSTHYQEWRLSVIR